MPVRRSPSPPAQRVLLVGWSSADWKIASPLIEAGELPQLANLVNQGASGPLGSLPPYLSPMLWNSIATGKYADQHGILGYTSSDSDRGKLVPTNSTQRECKALWNILSEHGLNTHVLGWSASHPAENINGICVTEAFTHPVKKGAPWPLVPDSIHPPALADEFAELRLRPEDVDPAVLKLFVPRAAEIDQTKDHRLSLLAVRLAELYSLHNATIASLDEGDSCDFLAVQYPFIQRICRDFITFHPPRRPHVPEREFELYRDVVNSAYRLQDLLLNDLLSHTGSDTTLILCSDHGLQGKSLDPQHIPPVSVGGEIDHRTQGILAAVGPGIARDTLIPGASILDLAPTLLHLFGLPPADDMPGRILTAVLSAPVTSRSTIPSYETDHGLESQPRPRHLTSLTEPAEAALLSQFVALGYLDPTSPDPEQLSARIDRDNRWHLALNLRHAGQHEQALALLDALYLERPEDPRYAFHLAMSQLHLGLNDEAALTAETLHDLVPGDDQIHRLLADIALARQDAAAALAQLESLSGISNHDIQAALLKGRALYLLGRFPEAYNVGRAIVEANPEDPIGWLGCALALLKCDQPDHAETCARQCIALSPSLSMAHFALGQALAAQRKNQAARDAITRAHELNPQLAITTRALGFVSGQQYISDAPNLTDALAPAHPPAALRITSTQRRESHAHQLAQDRGLATPTSSTSPAPFTIRPPWPDERARIAAAFPQLILHPDDSPLLLLTGTHPERIVGVASISPPINHTASLSLALRPRYLQEPAPLAALITQARNLARDAGATQLITRDQLVPDSPLVNALTQHGFSQTQRHELWSVDLARIHERTERLHVRLERAGRLSDFTSAPLHPDHLPAVRQLMAEEGLLDGQAISLIGDQSGRGYDPKTSFVVLTPSGQLAGAILARWLEKTVVSVEARAIASPWRTGLNLANHLLLRSFIQAAHHLGAQRFIFTIDVSDQTKQNDTQNMARRTDGKCHGVFVRLQSPC